MKRGAEGVEKARRQRREGLKGRKWEGETGLPTKGLQGSVVSSPAKQLSLGRSPSANDFVAFYVQFYMISSFSVTGGREIEKK